MPRSKFSKTKKATPITRAAPADEWKKEYEGKHSEWAARLSLNELETRDRAHLAACQAILRDDHGCSTPFQEFFAKLVGWVVYMGKIPTPDIVAGELDDFRENFTDMERDALIFLGSYPEIAAKLNGADKGAEVTSDAA